MEHAELKKLICKAVNVGEDINPHTAEQLDIIDAELLKLGTLSHDSIDWKAGRIASENLLATHKNIKALTLIWNDLLRQATAENVLLVIETINFVIEHQLDIIHPFEKKFNRLKSARLKEIILAAMGKTAAVDFSDNQISELNQLLDVLRKIAPSYGIDADKIEVFELGERTQVSSEGGANGVSSVLDAKGRADLRRDIRLLASKITNHDPDAGVAYFLRSYGAWMELTSLPESDATGITSMNAMPGSIVSEFNKELELPSSSGLQRLEDRLSNSPDWFEGHFMASQIADKLGLNSVSKLIRQRVQYRLRQLPEIQNLRYANGDPIVPDNIKEWVNTQPIEKSFKKDKSQYRDKNDVEEVVSVQDLLEQFESLYKSNITIKDKSIKSIQIAKKLRDLKLTHLSKKVLAEVNDLFSNTSIQEWEPDLYKEIKLLMAE